VLATSEHLAACQACVTHAIEELDLDSAARDLCDEIERDPQSSRARWAFAIAASLVVAFASIMLLRGTEPRATPPVVVNSPAAPVRSEPRAHDARTEWDSLVAKARAGSFPSMPEAVRSLQQASEILRGGDAEDARFSPEGVALRTARPEFGWTAEKGARSTVLIFHDDVEVMRSEETDATRWRAPRALKRGAAYSWQVIMRNDDSVVVAPAPPARFYVVDAASLAELDAAQRQHPDDHLLLGLLCLRAGLTSDARAHFEAVRDVRDAPVARRARLHLDR
jgi:hypothetical protein